MYRKQYKLNSKKIFLEFTGKVIESSDFCVQLLNSLKWKPWIYPNPLIEKRTIGSLYDTKDPDDHSLEGKSGHSDL